MAMTELSGIIQDWEANKERYFQLTKYIERILSERIAEKGIQVRIYSRTKTQNSIIKKLYTKKQVNFDYYNEMTDKSAARIICRLKEQIPDLEEIINESFITHYKEDKINHLDFYEQGYKSIHFGVQPKEELTDESLFQNIGDLRGEIQLRTSCEDVWAEIYHDLGYKPSFPLPQELNRQFHCLAGLLEVADNCFSALNNKIKSSETVQVDFVLDYLITPYIKFIRESYDPEFSRLNIQPLIPIINKENPSEFIERMNLFIKVNEGKISQILKERSSESEIPYITQPEIFLIFYLIEKRQDELISIWARDFLIEDLKKICLWWGKPFEDDEY